MKAPDVVEKDRLLGFLNRWRDRILSRGHAHELDGESFGQLVTLNTLIEWVHRESSPADAVVRDAEAVQAVADAMRVNWRGFATMGRTK